jgi:hypothetical protein
LRQKHEEAQQVIGKLRLEAEERFRQLDSLTLENERLKVKSSLNLKETGLSKSYTISEVGKSLQLSNNGSHRLLQKNAELQQLCSTLSEEIEYQKLREKKVMYLIYVLENRGYPVRQVFEQEVKQIATERFTDFDQRHAVQDEALFVLKVPLGQSLHPAEETTENVPASQGAQAACAALRWKVPRGQGLPRHAAKCVPFVKEPAGQRRARPSPLQYEPTGQGKPDALLDPAGQNEPLAAAAPVRSQEKVRRGQHVIIRQGRACDHEIK